MTAPDAQPSLVERLERAHACIHQIIMIAGRPDVYPTSSELIHSLARHAHQDTAHVINRLEQANQLTAELLKAASDLSENTIDTLRTATDTPKP